MIKQQIFNIVLSIILLPVNFYCAFWLLREALNLTGMTFKEFTEYHNTKMLNINVHRHRMIRIQRLLADFFYENSSNPKKSIRLTRTFGFCALFGLGALCIATYAAINPDKQKYAFIGNMILLVINIALAVLGRVYGKSNPIDALTAEKLEAKREHNREDRTKNIIVYAIVGALFFGVLFFFMAGTAGIVHSEQMQKFSQSAISIQAELITVLNEKGYETANVPTTYWEFDENKLEHIAAGVKGDGRFEFYGYSDGETVDLVYNQIVYCTAPDMENAERENHEVLLPDGNRMFTALIDEVYYLVMYRNDTVIYAYSSDSLGEINEILAEIGYLKNR